jgi:ERCC4-related helicase
MTMPLPHLLVNQIHKAGANLEDISLLVMDECHHCRWAACRPHAAVAPCH